VVSSDKGVVQVEVRKENFSNIAKFTLTCSKERIQWSAGKNRRPDRTISGRKT